MIVYFSYLEYNCPTDNICLLRKCNEKNLFSVFSLIYALSDVCSLIFSVVSVLNDFSILLVFLILFNDFSFLLVFSEWNGLCLWTLLYVNVLVSELSLLKDAIISSSNDYKQGVYSSKMDYAMKLYNEMKIND